MIREIRNCRRHVFFLAIIVIQGISDKFYSIQELSGIFMEFSSRDIKEWYKIEQRMRGERPELPRVWLEYLSKV
jgi:hypothetical protein